MPNVSDVYRLTWVGANPSGEPLINTYYYRISVVGAGDEKAALAAAWQAAVNGALQACQANTQQWKQIIVQPVKPVGTTEVFTPNVSLGSLATANLPSQCAVILTRKTATPGKGGRGRIFIGAVPVSQQVAADPNTVTTTNFQALANALMLTLTSGGWSFIPVLWKRRLAISLDLTAITVNPLIKTRRSRVEGQRFHRRKKHTVGSI